MVMYHNFIHQVILNCLGKNDNPRVIKGEVYDEDVMIPVHRKSRDMVVIRMYHLLKSILYYSFYEYREALEHIKSCEKYRNFAIGHVFIPILCFYGSLICAAMYPGVSVFKKIKFLG